MQIQLKYIQPKLEEAAIETKQVMATLEIDKKEADETQKIISVESEAQIQTKRANEIKREADESVVEANRILETTLIIEDYFTTAKKYLLNDTKTLLDQLLDYKRDNINQTYIKKLEQKIIGDPDFKLERANTCSLAIKYMYSWCQAMYDYNKIFLQTQPLRDKLAQAQMIVDQQQALLKVKKEQLEAVNSKIKRLQEEFDEKVKFKEDLSKKSKNVKLNQLELKNGQVEYLMKKNQMDS